MEYNTQRPKLRVPEYGRNIQLLVEQIVHIPNREIRTQAAFEMVSLMAQQNPNFRNQPEMVQTLWEHLFIISDFKLDVDSPFPPPDEQNIHVKPDRKLVDYPGSKMKYHFYGKNVELMIDSILKMEDGSEKDKLSKELGSYMRVCYKIWNDEKVSDSLIINHLKELSGGKIVLDNLPEPVKLNGPKNSHELTKKKKKKKNRRSYR